ncbi:MAG: hypothetical protein M8357_06230 [Desulfobulbaceae bacterium]|nr:hypothetical protein [Desulfobulbaceae bacterium]
MTSDTIGRFAGDGLPVLIGSLPLDSHQEALDWIFEATPEIPLWPQLPSNPREQMLPQFAEGIPCIREEDPVNATGRIYYDTAYDTFADDMLAFYEEYIGVAENISDLANSRFTTSRERAAGLYALAERLPGAKDLRAVKGQVTGPFTMLTGIKDTQGRAGYFDETIREMTTKGIAMKAAWQTSFLSAGNAPVLMFIDEPALAGLGSSAFISVTTAEIREMINEVAGAIHLAGGLAGIHVCANTDWELLLDSEIDVLSFDAYGFFDRIAPLQKEINAYLDRGNIIAWGGIPTSREEDIRKESVQSLADLWNTQMDAISGPGRNKADLLRQTIITPSCGTGSLSPELAGRVLELTRAVAMELRKQHL